MADGGPMGGYTAQMLRRAGWPGGVACLRLPRDAASHGRRAACPCRGRAGPDGCGRAGWLHLTLLLAGWSCCGRREHPGASVILALA